MSGAFVQHRVCAGVQVFNIHILFKGINIKCIRWILNATACLQNADGFGHPTKCIAQAQNGHFARYHMFAIDVCI